MRVFVVGASGPLGRALARVFAQGVMDFGASVQLLLTAAHAGAGLWSHGTQILVLFTGLLIVLVPSISWAQSLAAAVLPGSRSVRVGTPATAFATLINTGSGSAMGCSIAPITSVAATFSYQTTDRTTNAITGAVAVGVHHGCP